MLDAALRGPRIYFRPGPPAPARPLVLTVPEACESLRVSRWTLYQLIRTGQLVTIKIGRRRCVPVAAVQQLIERLQHVEAV